MVSEGGIAGGIDESDRKKEGEVITFVRITSGTRENIFLKIRKECLKPNATILRLLGVLIFVVSRVEIVRCSENGKEKTCQ